MCTAVMTNSGSLRSSYALLVSIDHYIAKDHGMLTVARQAVI